MQNNSHVSINFGGQQFELLANGCMFWPLTKALIIADLHLEKGSYLASHGSPLPVYDTKDTLCRLQKVIHQYQPETVICLGDNIHDSQAFSRMHSNDIDFLQSITQSVNNWLWIVGNHEKINMTESAKTISFLPYIIMNNIYFTHDFLPHVNQQIGGHYHPKILLNKDGLRLQGKCFVVTYDKLIMPSFGSYTGGLEVKNKAYLKILNGPIYYYLIYDNKVWHVSSALF